MGRELRGGNNGRKERKSEGEGGEKVAVEKIIEQWRGSWCGGEENMEGEGEEGEGEKILPLITRL